MAGPFTEGTAQRALARYFDWQQKPVFINAFLFSWEMDVCVVTDAGYIWEIEVKTSIEDWRADQFKDKWKHPDIAKVSRLYYAVPWTLIDKIPAFVGDHIGIIALHVNNNGKGLVARLHREAKSKRGYTLPPAKMIQLYRTTYFKYWGQIAPQLEDAELCQITLEQEPKPTDSDLLDDYSGPWVVPSPIPSAPSPSAGGKPKPKSQPTTKPSDPPAPSQTTSLSSWTRL